MTQCHRAKTKEANAGSWHRGSMQKSVEPGITTFTCKHCTNASTQPWHSGVWEIQPEKIYLVMTSLFFLGWSSNSCWEERNEVGESKATAGRMSRLQGLYLSERNTHTWEYASYGNGAHFPLDGVNCGNQQITSEDLFTLCNSIYIFCSIKSLPKDTNLNIQHE